MPTIILMRTETMIVPQGGMLSNVLAIPDVTIVGIVAPDPTDHNTVYFDVSPDNQAFFPLDDMAGSPVRCMLTRGHAATFDSAIFRPWWYVRLRFNVAAAAERRYVVLVRPAWGG